MERDRWSELERIYQAAFDRPAGERADFLRENCPDPDLRREIESLLGHVEEGDRLLESAASSEIPTLLPGQRFGPYEIVSEIGAGGMGKVYRALDTRLLRHVAVKVCAPRHLERFQREGKAVAALSHPNVCTLYDAGPNYLVMELVEGQTLTQRLREGPIGRDEGLRYAIQIADALAAAHDRGILHRDIKPGNLMISGGSIKVLDFGLAKFAGTAGGSGGLTSLSGGQPALGTLAYMPPEQLTGGECDVRSDIYSLGLVLEEMFGSAALEPPLASVIRRCTARNPNDRWPAASQLRSALEGCRNEVRNGLPAWIRRPAVKWALASCLGGLAMAGAWFWWPSKEPTHAHFTLGLPAGTRIPLRMPTKAAVALAPNGRQLAVVLEDASGVRSLWLRTLESSTMTRIEQTEGASYAFWSPDSRHAGFFAKGKLKKVLAAGGVPQTICETGPGDGEGASWSEDGSILFAPPRPAPAAIPKGALLRVNASGGKPEPATQLDSGHGDRSHTWPQYLPGGRQFLYLARNADPEKTAVFVQDVETGRRKVLLANQTQAVAATGPKGRPYLLFTRDRALLAQPYHPGRMEVEGDAHAIAREVSYNTLYGTSAFSVSETGVLAFRSGIISTSTSPIRRLAWFSRQGRRLAPAGPPGEYSSFALSPDESRIAIDKMRQPNVPEDWDIWLLEVSTGVFSRLVEGRLPAWSPDSKRIAAVSQGQRLVEVPVASGKSSLVFDGGERLQLDSWTPDGRHLLFRSPAESFRIAPVPGARTSRSLDGDASKARLSVSPDGKWIAYHSAETGRTEVYVESFPLPGQKRQVSSGGGGQPVWSADGRELFFLTLNSNLMVVETGLGPVLETSPPRFLFETPVEGNPILRQYAVSRDGQRFLFLEADRKGSEAVEQFSVDLSWYSELAEGGARAGGVEAP